MYAENDVMGEIQFEGKSHVEKTSGVWVDGQYVGYLKELKGSKKVLLLPGEHVITVRQDGYQDFTERILVQPGQKEVVRVAMEKEGISPTQGGLRLGVQGGGCSGLSYNIRFDTQPRERDRVFQFGDLRLFVDPKSFIYLSGMILDYENTLMKQGFNFINPNASRSCGCGSSFSA